MSDKPDPNFLQFLARFERGELVERLTTEVKDIVAAMEQVAQDHGIRDSKGELALTIKFKRSKDRYEIVVESKTKKPKGPPASEIMWASPSNSLVPEDPRQQRMAFMEVTTPRGSA